MMIKYYRQGMKQYDAFHPESQTLKGQLQCVREEFNEFRESYSVEEFFDVIHTVGRVIEYVTGIWWFCLVAWPTVKKHAKRVEEYGCPRSRRNCCGRCQRMTEIAQD